MCIGHSIRAVQVVCKPRAMGIRAFARRASIVELIVITVISITAIVVSFGTAKKTEDQPGSTGTTRFGSIGMNPDVRAT